MKRKLNDVIIRNAKPKEDGKPKKYTDGGRLFLLVNKKGKYWRYNYQFAKIQKTISFGVYPEVSLKDARIAHEKARELLSRNIDPSEHRKISGGAIA